MGGGERIQALVERRAAAKKYNQGGERRELAEKKGHGVFSGRVETEQAGIIGQLTAKAPHEGDRSAVNAC